MTMMPKLKFLPKIGVRFEIPQLLGVRKADCLIVSARTILPKLLYMKYDAALDAARCVFRYDFGEI